MTVAYGFVVLDVCGVIWIVAGMFGRWRANPGQGYERQVITFMGMGIDLRTHLGAMSHGRVDLYLAATRG